MSVSVTYPGVYIQELPSSVHTITGVATSIGAFVDAFVSSPLNHAVQILSFADFETQSAASPWVARRATRSSNSFSMAAARRMWCASPQRSCSTTTASQ